eukprot:11203238-Lingulodinium_polyedra.AAC.1
MFEGVASATPTQVDVSTQPAAPPVVEYGSAAPAAPPRDFAWRPLAQPAAAASFAGTVEPARQEERSSASEPGDAT